MESIKDIFKIGYGPSSSHTMGPRNAAEIFLNQNPNNDIYKVTLYGSLAATGKGHLTDIAIKEIFDKKEKELEIIWKPEVFLRPHPNGLLFKCFNKIDDTNSNNLQEINRWRTFSIGGGDLSDTGKPKLGNKVYEFNKMKDILKWCWRNGKKIWEYVKERENEEIWDYLSEVWKVMRESVERGIHEEGVLPGGLNIPRKASSYFIKSQGYKYSLKSRGLSFAYALAVAEENASGGLIVTAPTCGSCGVLPSCIYSTFEKYKFSEKKIIRSLATAGLIGNIIKTNASISGADVGCQGEIGSACSMSAGSLVQLFGGTPYQIEHAARIGLEHFLGLTCDPIGGLVQIPCIERNAFATTRALDANIFACIDDGKHYVSFDTVVEAMNQCGKDLPSIYKETSLGGLAKFAYDEVMSKC